MSATITLPAEHAEILQSALLDSRRFCTELAALAPDNKAHWDAQVVRVDATLAALATARFELKQRTKGGAL